MIQSNAWPTQEQKWLLKAALLNGDAAEHAWSRWREQIDFDQLDAASYKLLGLVSKNQALQEIQDPVFEKCRGIYRRTWVSNQIIWNSISPLLAQIGKGNGTPVVLLKGMAMILHVYRDFGVRVIGDIDFLIRKNDLLFAAHLLRIEGWKQNVARFDIGNEEHLKRWHALNFTHPNGFHLDLHWSFIQENSPLLDEAVFLNALPIENSFCFVPDSTSLLLQTCVHGVKFSPVPLIRWIADAVMLIRNPENKIDWDRLTRLANLAHVCMPLYFGLIYLKEEFSVSIPDEAIYQLKRSSSLRLEYGEYKWNLKGYPHLASWYRYCLNELYLTRWSQWVHLCKYLQITARLKSPWYIPFFSIYWIMKRAYRLSKRLSLK